LETFSRHPSHELPHRGRHEGYQEDYQQDGYDRYVANESAYNGPDPEKVLSLYTALFHTLIAG